MRKRQFFISASVLLVALLFVLGCGTGGSNLSGTSHFPVVPQSITLSPSAVDAQTYPDGQVSFVATGNYIDPARTVTPQPVQWGVCQNNTATTGVMITQAGVAQCAAGAKGIYTVFGYDMTGCNVLSVCGGGCTAVGTAQLTCP